MKLYEFPPTRSIRARWTLLKGFPRLQEYMERMYARPHAPMRIAQAFASIRGGEGHDGESGRVSPRP